MHNEFKSFQYNYKNFDFKQRDDFKRFCGFEVLSPFPDSVDVCGFLGNWCSWNKRSNILALPFIFGV